VAQGGGCPRPVPISHHRLAPPMSWNAVYLVLIVLAIAAALRAAS
jgi:hypothetical protein